jgi:phosphoribosylanthranilate isomerase
MKGPFVKVCGITRREDALAAVGAGARAVGFVFVAGSPREVTPQEAQAIGAELPATVARVGVIRDLDPARARELAVTAGLTALQAHGSESLEDCRAYGLPVVKAFAAGLGFDPAQLERYRGWTVLLDGGIVPGQGGTGEWADWAAARYAVEHGFRVVLAGGLAPENLRAAVEAVGPAAVDLNSGVETAPGRKAPERLAAAFRALADLEPPEETSWPW